MEPFDASAVRAAYDVLAEDHAEAFADDLLGLTVDREVSILSFQGSPKRSPSSILDADPARSVAPGPAGSSGALYGSGSPDAPRGPRRTGNRCLACGDVRSIPFGVASFSAVVAFHSVHHLPRATLRTALAEIRRILKPAACLWSPPEKGIR